MFCEKCGGELRQDGNKLICQKCGVEYGLDYSDGYNVTYSVGGEQVTPRGFSSKKIIVIIIIVAILVLGGVGAGIAVGISTHSAQQIALSGIQLAEKYLSEQNYEQAIIAFEQILEIEPMNVDAYLGLADAYEHMGDHEKAIKVLNDGYELTKANKIGMQLKEMRGSSLSSSTSSVSSASSIPQSEVLELSVVNTIVAEINNSWKVGSDKNPRMVNLHDNYMALIAHEQYGGGARVFSIDVDKWVKTGEFSFAEIHAGDDGARELLKKCIDIVSFYDFLEINTPEGLAGSLSVIETNGKPLLYVTGHGFDQPASPAREDGYSLETRYLDDYSGEFIAVVPPEGSGAPLIHVNIGEWIDVVQCSKGETVGVVISKGKVYAVKKDGTTTVIDDNSKAEYGFLGRVPIWESAVGIKLLGTDGNVHILKIDNDSYIYAYLDDNLNYIVGRSIATNDQSYLYRVVSPYDGKILTGEYAQLEALEDGMYFAATEQNGCGFINSTGKQLAWFDQADTFLEKNRFAPVVKDGKGWLIDKSMNRVSEIYDATTATALNNEVFYFGSEQNKTLVKITD